VWPLAACPSITAVVVQEGNNLAARAPTGLGGFLPLRPSYRVGQARSCSLVASRRGLWGPTRLCTRYLGPGGYLLQIPPCVDRGRVAKGGWAHARCPAGSPGALVLHITLWSAYSISARGHPASSNLASDAVGCTPRGAPRASHPFHIRLDAISALPPRQRTGRGWGTAPGRTPLPTGVRPSTSLQRAAGLGWGLRIVGRLANLPTIQTLGGKPKPVAALAGVTGGRYPPPAGYMSHAVGPSRGPCRRAADQPVGNLVGAIG
jgi:hypothetical protein